MVYFKSALVVCVSYSYFLFSVNWLQVFVTVCISLLLGKAQDWMKSNKAEENPKYIIKQPNNVS